MKVFKKPNQRKIFFFIAIILLFICGISNLNAVEVGRLLWEQERNINPDQFFTGGRHTLMMRTHSSGYITITKINCDNGLINNDSLDRSNIYFLPAGLYGNFRVFKTRVYSFLFVANYSTLTGYVYPIDLLGRISVESSSIIDEISLSTAWTNVEFFTVDSGYFMFFYDRSTGDARIYSITNDGLFNDTPVEITNIGSGWDNIKFYTAGGETYVCYLDGSYSNLQFRRMNTDGTIGEIIDGGSYMPGWTNIEFFIYEGTTRMLLMSEYDTRIHIFEMNDDGTLSGLIEEHDFPSDMSSVNVYQIAPNINHKNLILSGDGTRIYEMNPDSLGSNNLPGVYEIPSNFHVDTYSIEDYPGDNWWEELMRPNGMNINHWQADNFANTLVDQINTNFPEIYSRRIIEKRDEEVTVDDYYCNIASDFVYFSGYACEDFLSCYDGAAFPDDFAYRQATKWAIHDAPKSLASEDPLFYFPMFNGLHAIFGYASSDVREYALAEDDCSGPFLCDEGRYLGSTKDYPIRFAELWVNDLETLWDAYNTAISEEVYGALDFSIAPKVVYLEGNVDGLEFDGSIERLAPGDTGLSNFLFDAPVALHNMNLMQLLREHGTPTY